MEQLQILPNIQYKKIAFISDTHLNIWRKQNTFFHHVEEAFNFFAQQCIDRKIELIIHCGDLFHAKETVATEGLLRTNSIINRLSDICPVVIIPGNHDIVSKDNVEINLASNYLHFSNVYVINQPMYITVNNNTKMYLMPYYRNVAEKIATEDFDKGSYFVGHFGVKTFEINSTSNDYINEIAGDVLASSLNKFKHCFLGHYHGYQTKLNITYISAPFQSVFGDEFSDHGFVFFDSFNNTHDFVVNPYTPSFITVEFTKKDLKKLLGIEKHYIRLLVKKEVPQDLLLKIKYKLLEKNYDVMIKMQIEDTVKIATSKDWAEIVFEDTDTLFRNYVDYLEEQKTLPKGYSSDFLLSKLGVSK